ncbi:MAG TPA: hypothetical protein VGG16_21915 [Streptosporangiaceae bacterium]
MPKASPRHCKHCLGDCPGDCLNGNTGRCLHGWNGPHRRRFNPRYLMARGWWRQLLWGPGRSRTNIP